MWFVLLSNMLEVLDLYFDGFLLQVCMLLYVVKVFFEFELENLQGYDFILIVCLVCDGDIIKLVDNFIFFCYMLGGLEVFMCIIWDICDELFG